MNGYIQREQFERDRITKQHLEAILKEILEVKAHVLDLKKKQTVKEK